MRIRTRDPVLRPLPIGLKPLEGTADRFITQQTLRHAWLRAHRRRQSQRPQPRGLAIEARRLMQNVLETFTAAASSTGLTVFGRFDCFSKPATPRVFKARMT